MRRGAAREILIPIVEVYPIAIHQEFQFFPRYFSKGAIVVHEALVDGEQLEDVVTVSWELMLHNQSAARSERQALEMVVLRGVRRHAVGRQRRLHHVAHRQTAYFRRRRRVTFEQRRRQR